MTIFRASIWRRWTDLDAQGHVNNIVFAEYLQQARAVFFSQSDLVNALLAQGCIVVRHEIVYKAPIFYSDSPLDVHMQVSQIGASRFIISYEIYDDDRLCAQARSTLCPFDFSTRSPRRLSDMEREFLQRYYGDLCEIETMESVRVDGNGLSVEVYPRWSDPDRYGHINNVNFLEFILAGRIDMTTRLAPTMARIGQDGHSDHYWLIVRQDIDYLAQMSYRADPYRVDSAVIRCGRSSVSLASDIVDPKSGQTMATSTAVLVCTDTSLRSTPIPDDIRHALLKAQLSQIG